MSKNPSGFKQSPIHQYRGNPNSQHPPQILANRQDPRHHQQWQVPRQNHENPQQQSIGQGFSQNYQFGQPQYAQQNPGQPPFFHPSVQPTTWQNQNRFPPSYGPLQPPVIQLQPPMLNLTQRQLDDTIQQAIGQFYQKYCQGGQQRMPMQQGGFQHPPHFQMHDQEHAPSNPEQHATNHVKIGEDWIPLADKTKEFFQGHLMSIVSRENKKISRASAILEDCEKYWNMLMSGKLNLPSEKDVCQENVPHQSAVPGPEATVQENHKAIVRPLGRKICKSEDIGNVIDIENDSEVVVETATRAPKMSTPGTDPEDVAEPQVVPETETKPFPQASPEESDDSITVLETSQREESAPKSMDESVEIIMAPVMEIVETATASKSGNKLKRQHKVKEAQVDENLENLKIVHDSVEDVDVGKDLTKSKGAEPLMSLPKANENVSPEMNKNRGRKRTRNESEPQMHENEIVVPKPKTFIQEIRDKTDPSECMHYIWETLYYLKYQKVIRQRETLKQEMDSEKNEIILNILREIDDENEETDSLEDCRDRLELINNKYGLHNLCEKPAVFLWNGCQSTSMFLTQLRKLIDLPEYQQSLMEDMTFYISNEKFDEYHSAVTSLMDVHFSQALSAYCDRQREYRADPSIVPDIDKDIEIEIMNAKRDKTVTMPKFFNFSESIYLNAKGYEYFQKQKYSLEAGHHYLLLCYLLNASGNKKYKAILNFDFYYLEKQKDEKKMTSYLQLFTKVPLVHGV